MTTLEQDLRNVLALSESLDSVGYRRAVDNLIRQHGKELLERVAGEITPLMIERAATAISNQHLSNTGVPYPFYACRADARAALTAAMAKESADA